MRSAPPETTTAVAVKAEGEPDDDALLTEPGRRGIRWRRAVTPLVIVIMWQVGASAGLLDEKTFSSPWQVLDTFWTLAENGTLPRNLAISLVRIGIGLVLGGSTGVVLGLLSGLFRLGEDLIDAPLQMIRTMPVLALIPLFILWFGIGELPKVLIIALGAFFPLYLNTMAGTRNVDNRLLEAGKTLGLSRWSQIPHVIIPGALPNMLVGLRTSFGVAVIALVVSEQINASSGIGYLMTQAQQFFETNIIFVGLIIYAALGLAGDLIVRAIERRALSWRNAFAGS